MRVKARPIFDTIDNAESLRPPAGVGARLGSLMYRMYRMSSHFKMKDPCFILF